MLEPDFNKYRLALLKDSKIIYSSDKSGLRPLVECVKKFKGKIKDAILHDKVIGLAAAKLIVYSKMVSFVRAAVISTPANEYLLNNGIPVDARIITENILDKEKKNICPMELNAIEMDDEKFIGHIKKIFY